MPKSQFDDVPEWPEAKPAPAARDPNLDNQPPLEDRIVMDFDEQLAAAGVTKRIADLIASAERAPESIDDDKMAGKVGDLIKLARPVKEKVDGFREIYNRPLLTAQRTLKARADGVLIPLEQAMARIRLRLDKYAADQAEEARKSAKAAQQADYAARIIEHIKNCGLGFIDGQTYPYPILLHELEDKLALTAERAANDYGILADEVERVRVETLEALKKIISKSPKPAKEEVVASPPPPTPTERLYEPVTAAKPVARGDYGARVGTTQSWEFEIENMRKVPDRFLKHPKVKEALESVIRTAIRTEKVRELAGVRIWSVDKASVR